MNTINKILIWLSGKKGTIASIIGLTNGYLFSKGVYSEIDMYFIGSILVILFGVTSYATTKMYENK